MSSRETVLYPVYHGPLFSRRDLSAPNMLSQVVPLNGSNYAVWKNLIKNYIMSQKRWGHIEGTLSIPPRRIVTRQVNEDEKEVEVQNMKTQRHSSCDLDDTFGANSSGY